MAEGRGSFFTKHRPRSRIHAKLASGQPTVDDINPALPIIRHVP